MVDGLVIILITNFITAPYWKPDFKELTLSPDWMEKITQTKTSYSLCDSKRGKHTVEK